MTARTPTYLKGRFETNDIPTATDYEDVFDSYVNVETSATQSMAGTLYSPELNASLVSGTSGIFSFVSAQTVNAAFINAGAVSAVTVSATDVHIERKLHNGYQYLRPTGKAQSSAASVDYDVTNVLVTAAASAERSVILSEHHSGRIQYIINDTVSVTAVTIYPSSGCNFIGTAANGGLLLGIDQTMQIIHVNASAYAWVRY